MPEDLRFARDVAEAVEAMPATASLWSVLGRAGVPARLLPEPGAGPPVDHGRLGVLLAELDARLPMGPVLSVCVQVATVLPLLRLAAQDSPLAAKVLTAALDGHAVVALAATDADLSGSALIDSRTAIENGADGPRLTGGKAWITNASRCDYALVLARTRPERHFTSFGWVLVPADHPGVSREPVADLRYPGAGIGHLRFDRVRLGAEHLVGRRGRALAELTAALGTERLAGALWARALCRRVLRDTHRHLRTRSTGPGTLWDNAAVRERFAQALVEWRHLDAMCAIHSGRNLTVADGLVLKATAGTSTERILGSCVSLHGADAFGDGGLASLREQAAMFGVAGGATGAMLAGVADHAEQLLAGDP